MKKPGMEEDGRKKDEAAGEAEVGERKCMYE